MLAVMCHTQAYASDYTLTTTSNGKVSLAFEDQGSIIVGQSKEGTEYTVFSLDKLQIVREAGAGSGIIGGGNDAQIEPERKLSWGFAEIAFGCATADVAIYQYDEQGFATFHSAGTYASNYCPTNSK